MRNTLLDIVQSMLRKVNEICISQITQDGGQLTVILKFFSNEAN